MVVLLKSGSEALPTGEYLHLATNDYLQYCLASSDDHREMPVTVLDISDLPGPPPGESREVATSRPDLQRLVGALAAQEPRAIGVDIDFSPLHQGKIDPQDEGFFEFCLAKERETKVPIYLGIEASVDQPQGDWLGKPKYQPLAANLLIPNTVEPGDVGTEEGVRETPLWIQVKGISQECPSLAAALTANTARDGAGKLRYHTHEPPPWLDWAVRWSNLHTGTNYKYKSFRVNYGPLERLQKVARQLRTIDDEQVVAHAEFFRHRLVLLGNVDVSRSDNHGVPGRHRPIPGVLVHACAAYTLDEAPLYELTLLGRLLMDAGLALLILLAVTGIRWFLYRQRGELVPEHRLQRFLTTLTVSLVALAGGTVLVRQMGLIWDDFLFVIGALLIHSSVERFLDGMGRAIRERMGRLWGDLSASESGASH